MSARNSNLAPVPLSIFRSNSKFDENSECSSFEYARPITTIFCTRHDSDTVVTCAKYRCDRPRVFYTRLFWIFIEFRIRSKYALLDRSQRYFAHVTTVTLSWRVQNIVVIGRAYFTLDCFEFSSNFEFDRNMLSGTGARSYIECCMILCLCHLYLGLSWPSTND